MLRVGYIALCIIGLVAAAAPASAQYVSDRPEADNVPPGSQIAPRERLKHRCLREERKGPPDADLSEIQKRSERALAATGC